MSSELTEGFTSIRRMGGTESGRPEAADPLSSALQSRFGIPFPRLVSSILFQHARRPLRTERLSDILRLRDRVGFPTMRKTSSPPVRFRDNDLTRMRGLSEVLSQITESVEVLSNNP